MESFDAIVVDEQIFQVCQVSEVFGIDSLEFIHWNVKFLESTESSEAVIF